MMMMLMMLMMMVVVIISLWLNMLDLFQLCSYRNYKENRVGLIYNFLFCFDIIFTLTFQLSEYPWFFIVSLYFFDCICCI